ncbi:HNH endonuclease family protein [Actinomyces sp. B33]|uniref:HNH endonuclease family protein n=1 Tax=Actinomyces sp. B33 TaxID=2942131 RepID=UPI002340DDFF|nr:HNH endonuclease family protein [Actinomyces sp. B33]MDC4232425.1 HNH endonuclease family protein [Actinomyces sp. B33]
MDRVLGRAGRRRIGDLVVAAVVVVLLAWALVPGLGPDLLGMGGRWGWMGAGGTAVDALPDTSTARELKTLPVRGFEEEAAAPDYERDRFGQAWADEDRNGCDTRNDILARDLARPAFKPGTNDCVVVSGALAEPYVGETIEFQRGQDTSGLVQIDHVVALADAWRSGAWRWEGAQRQAFANDPVNLLAVDGQANTDKGAASADLWLPPNRAFRCEYVARQIRVKARWGLSVTGSEKEAMARVLLSCP